MRRAKQPKYIATIKGFYHLLPGNPSQMTKHLKGLYSAFRHIERNGVNKTLREIEKDLQRKLTP